MKYMAAWMLAVPGGLIVLWFLFDRAPARGYVPFGGLASDGAAARSPVSVTPENSERDRTMVITPVGERALSVRQSR